MACFTIVLKLCVLRRITPGTYPLYGNVHLRWAFVDRLCGSVSRIIISLVGGTWLAALWFRLLGASVEKGVSIETSFISEARFHGICIYFVTRHLFEGLIVSSIFYFYFILFAV
jgi:hypothetical protein